MTKKFNEENIRVAAYFLWENAGRPEGMEKEFWHQAYSQLMHVKPASCKSSVKAKKTAVKATVKACAKKSSANASILKSSLKSSLKPSVVAKPFYGIKK